MASKTAKVAVGPAHTAGIFADMTVDGPEIGTLVIIVDRAKNLPNRKAMGKQDPYCAARLGKEAKKTDTDKRGGQTPKWDQELRFTVHDSPDYYQLKVSVFNDDRKTELIGETWVSLEQIIIPGGGKQDQWHHLNCKGRFAGEIRIELTYYDTRPKEPKAEDRRQSGAISGIEDSHRENNCSVGGPRQPKLVKRRPLPSDPTMIDSSRSSPQPFTPPPAIQPFTSPLPEPQASPYEYRIGDGLPEDKRHHTLDQGRYRSSQSTVNVSDVFDDMRTTHDNYGEALEHSGHGQLGGSNVSADNLVQGLQHSTSQTRAPTYGEYENLAQTQNQQSYLRNGYSPSPQFDGRYDYPPNRTVPDALSMPKSNFPAPLPQHASMPEFGTREDYKIHAGQHHLNSLPRQGDYEQNSVRHYTPAEGYDSYSAPNQTLQDEAPPPPPVHRSSGLQSSPTPEAKPDNYPLISGPAPLNIRHARGSISASPLSQVHNNTPYTDYESSGSPTTIRQQPQSFSNRSYHHSYSSPERRQSPERFPVSPIRDPNHQTPPSLVPGYDPRAADEESDRLIREQQPVFRQASEPVPQYQAYAIQRTPNEVQPPRNDVPPQLRMLGNGQANRPHRASAPVIARREVSPESRMPMRKSVSPQPGPGEGERRQSAVPFGPDSYDTFNPSLVDAASINSVGPKYNTPEEANEAKHEGEREAKLAEGPIIGSDGREIDPSDHLPAETWAPEPETKAPKKKPEITVRFRRSPAGAQPMPVAGRRPTDPSVRPGPQVSPVYAHSSDAISPTSAARSRLQKKSRVAIAQPVSSPIIPTINSNVRGGMPRAASEHPLREHDNYGHNSSPTYARSSPTLPPPIPGKAPLNANTGQEDWGMNALSEEMRRIDIGVGAGSGRARRSRYGVSEAGRY